MALIGADDRIIEANPAFAAMIGHEAPNLVRTHIHEIIDPEDSPGSSTWSCSAASVTDCGWRSSSSTARVAWCGAT
ncbi:PAS domain-containing protein [Kitasatospora gansuensis]